jgi:transposase
MGTIILSDQQQRRAQILERLCTGRITTADAARLLVLSERQVRRLKRDYMETAMESVVHGNAGRVPANKTDPQVADKIRELAGSSGVYQNYNTCHMADMLARDHDITIGRATLDRLLITSGLRKRKRPGERVVRKRRKRRAAEGAMIQLDGSPYAWLGDAHPSFCLLGGIDDATSKVVGATFRPTEDQAGYLILLRRICVTHGIPMSVYHDKHTILRSPKEPTIEDELAGKLPMSQVGRVLDRLGIEQIIAHSPQAKGRIERLWNTLQDRLANELVTAGVQTIAEANAFLPDFIACFNAKFARAPAENENVWTPLEPDMDLDYHFSTTEVRIVKADHTVTCGPKTLQLVLPKRAAPITGQKVEVHGLPDGTLAIYLNRKRVAHKQLPAAPQKACPPEQPKPRNVVAVDTDVKRASRRRQMQHLFAGTPR